jgi:osmotically-inducible protein OsmY
MHTHETSYGMGGMHYGPERGMRSPFGYRHGWHPEDERYQGRRHGGDGEGMGLVRSMVLRAGMWLQRWAERGSRRMMQAGDRVQDWAESGREQASRMGASMRQWADAPRGEQGGSEAMRHAGREERPFVGRGPKGYQRSDERIREDVSDRLSEGYLDASDIEVTVSGGEVTLGGTVRTKEWKRLSEDIAESIAGVKQVHNHLHVRAPEYSQSWQGEGRFGPTDAERRPPTMPS